MTVPRLLFVGLFVGIYIAFNNFKLQIRTVNCPCWVLVAMAPKAALLYAAHLHSERANSHLGIYAVRLKYKTSNRILLFGRSRFWKITEFE